MNSIKGISLFSGAGGMDLGFQKAGIDIVWANDIDKYAVQTYEHNIGSHIRRGSIYDFDFNSLPDCDLIFGGPPCQGFSVAGKMDVNDPRSKLIFVFQDIVRAKNPKLFVMENVAALARLDKFSEIRNRLIDNYIGMGYDLKMQILNANNYGVPQNRERVILIGSKNPSFNKYEYPPKVKSLSVRESLSSFYNTEPPYNPETEACRARITVAQHPILRKSPYAGMIFNGMGRPINLDGAAPTLPASMGGNKTPIIDTLLLRDRHSYDWIKEYHSMLIKGTPFDAYKINVPEYIRRISVREAARLQGFPANFRFIGSQVQQYKQIGNSVPPEFAYHIAMSIREYI